MPRLVSVPEEKILVRALIQAHRELDPHAVSFKVCKYSSFKLDRVFFSDSSALIPEVIARYELFICLLPSC